MTINRVIMMERMNKALKKMMSTPHETQKQIIERRRRKGEIKPRKIERLPGNLKRGLTCYLGLGAIFFIVIFSVFWNSSGDRRALTSPDSSGSLRLGMQSR
jgi:hypothetical protein